jgi:hypothetical protein
MQRIVSAWFSFLAFLARNRTVVVSTVGVFAPAFLALSLRALTDPSAASLLNLWVALYIPAQLLLVLASVAPARYARVQLLESMLPAIHTVFNLKPTDRVTIHHLRNRNDQTYEQLTNYHTSRIGRGRIFRFHHGIVGQCLTNRTPLVYSVPEGKSFLDAMKEDWSFTENELSRLTQDRNSFFAFPIGYEEEYAKAVLYMDSADRATFTNDKKQEFAQKVEGLFLPLLNQLILA